MNPEEIADSVIADLDADGSLSAKAAERKAIRSRIADALDRALSANNGPGPPSDNGADVHAHLPAEPERYTDAGNARRLVAAHGHRFRYVPAWGSWLRWDGRRWARDTKGLIFVAAKRIADSLWDEAIGISDKEERRTAIRWAMSSESAGRLKAMVELARTEPGIPVDVDELDGDQWALNCLNGVLDLRTGTLSSHDPARLITKLAHANFDPQAEATTWGEFVKRILPEPEVREYVNRGVGYGATGSVAEQVLFFCWGAGANGKSTFFDAVRYVLGDYARQADPELLVAKANAHPTGVADLQGARFVTCLETERNRRMAEATVKRLTGGDRVKARYMMQDFFEFDPTFTLFLFGNHKPVVKGTDRGIWRRIKLVPFVETIPETEQDGTLPDQLRAEVDGILAWIVGGCLRWQQEGLPEPADVITATAAYRIEQDTLAAFLEDCCTERRDLKVPAADLYERYKTWCTDNGEHAETQKNFGAALTEKDFERRQYGHAKHWHWFGLALVTTEKEPSEKEPSS